MEITSKNPQLMQSLTTRDESQESAVTATRPKLPRKNLLSMRAAELKNRERKRAGIHEDVPDGVELRGGGTTAKNLGRPDTTATDLSIDGLGQEIAIKIDLPIETCGSRTLVWTQRRVKRHGEDTGDRRSAQYGR